MLEIYPSYKLALMFNLTRSSQLEGTRPNVLYAPEESSLIHLFRYPSIYCPDRHDENGTIEIARHLQIGIQNYHCKVPTGIIHIEFGRQKLLAI